MSRGRRIDAIPPDPCEVCGKVMRRHVDIKRHMLIHLSKEDMPFRCTINGCTAAFVQKNNLDNHIRVLHTGEKPFPCPFTTELSCSEMFQTSYKAHGHMQAAHRDYLYHCVECSAGFAPKNPKGKTTIGWKTRKTFKRHVGMDHPGCDIEQLIIAPRIALRELTPPYIDRPNPKYITHWRLSPPPPASSSATTTRASSEAVSTIYGDERDELESVDHYSEPESEEEMDIDHTWHPPRRVLARNGVNDPNVPPALSAAFVTTDTNRLTPFVQQDVSGIRSRSNSSPSTPLSAPRGGVMVPARFQGFIYVPQPQNVSSATTAARRDARAVTTPYSPARLRETAAVPSIRTIAHRSDNEASSPLTPEDSRTTILRARARANTAPDAQAQDDSGLLPPMQTTGFIVGEPSILSPFLHHNDSAATPSRLSTGTRTPGGWSTSSAGSASADSNVRERSSSSSSWATPAPDLSASLARWSISNMKGNYPVETSLGVSSAGSLIRIPPLHEPISTSTSPTTPNLSKSFGSDGVDRARSSTPSLQPQDHRYNHRRTYSNI